MHFAPEGFRIALPVFGIAALVLVVGVVSSSRPAFGVGGFLLVLSFCMLWFFRDPVREIPAGDDVVVAPADGTVLCAETLPDGRQHVGIFLSVFNVHVNRVPFSGTIVQVIDKPGEYFRANTRQADSLNARVDIEAETTHGMIAWRQVSGAIARRIACRVKAGDAVKTGEKFGLIYFGSRMDVFLPPSAELTISKGVTTVAGETIIARFLTDKGSE